MKYFNELSNVYWARPETVLWATRQMQLLDNLEFKSPSLDLMCGHGIWSFVKAGGNFDYDFDCYQDIISLDQYNKGIDIQNSFSDKYIPNILKKPNYKIDYGLDLKENNLKKSSKLNFYNNLIHADCNKILPFENDKFSTIFSNTIYWVDNIQHILMELFRITKNDGKIYLINLLPKLNNYITFYKNHNFPNQWFELIDRNRSKENKHILTKEGWYLLFSESGFEVKEYIPTINQTYAHIWNIGLRPFTGYILKLAQKLNKNELYKKKLLVKKQIKMFTQFAHFKSLKNIIDLN